MAEKCRDVTKEYEEAEAAAENFDPGDQPDIAALMRSAFIHGYAQALIDYPEISTAGVDLYPHINKGTISHRFQGERDPANTSWNKPNCSLCGKNAFDSIHTQAPAVEKQGQDDECDHYIGLFIDDYSQQRESQLIEVSLFTDEQDPIEVDVRFHFCPLCGEALPIDKYARAF